MTTLLHEATVAAYPVAKGHCKHCGRATPRWTPKSIIDAFDKWHETHGRAPSTHDWRKASYENPSADQVLQVFGSFDRGRRAAGLRYIRRNYVGPWTKAAILEAILKWHFEHGQPPKAREWFSPPEGFPSTGTVRRKFGSWNRAITQAGYPARRMGGRHDRLAA